MTPKVQLITAALVAAGAAQARPSMHEQPAATSRLQDFKARIGFDALAAKEAPGKGIVAEWPSCAALLGLVEPDWSGEWSGDNDLFPFEEWGLASRGCVLERPGERLSVRIFVSGRSGADVRENLVDLATQTTLPTIPYEPGPQDLATLCLVFPARDAHIVSFYNVGFVVVRKAGAREVAPLVRNAIAFARRHLVDHPEARAPRVKRFEVPRTLRVGEAVEVKLELEPAGADLRFDYRASYQTLKQDREADGTFTITGRSPGEGEVELWVVDRKTLLNVTETRPVRVLPAERAP